MKKLLISFILILVQLQLVAQETKKPINVEVYGQGQPIIFIPGFTVPGEIWMPTVEKLKANYECHVLTLAGFGGVTPIEFPWLPKINSSIQNYIADNSLDNVIVVGHSLGGTIGLWLASREDSKISQLIIVDGLPASGALMIPNYNPDDLVYESPYNQQMLDMNDENFEEMASGMASGMSLNPEQQQTIKDWILMADRKTYVYGYTDYLKLDLREDLKQISAKVNILAATQPYGETMVNKTYATQYENLNDYNLILVENSAHFIMLDQPDKFNSIIVDILSVK
jgi:pimeloyl-ACP methyl ester carboxylesterase